MGSARPARDLNGVPVVVEAGEADVSVRVGGRPLVVGIAPTFRDEHWGTVPLEWSPWIVHGTSAVSRASHAASGDLLIEWTLDVVASGDTVKITAQGTSRRSIRVRRVGLCLLLPVEQVEGAHFTATPDDGPPWSGRFLPWIAPQSRVEDQLMPMGPAFDRLDITLPDDQQVSMEFSGDLFELEDQRNWTDPSFKIYCTPLARSQPRELAAGDLVQQTVTFRCVTRGSGPEVRVVVAEPEPEDVVSLTDVPVGPMATLAPIGLTVAPDALSAKHLELLARADPSHVRIEAGEGPASVRRLAALSELGIPVELALSLDGEVEMSWWALAARDDVVRVLVSRRDRRTVTASDLAARSELLKPIWGKLVTGTRDQFAELNRNPDTTDAPAVAFAVTAQAHVTSETAMAATVATHRQVVAQAATLHPGRAIVVSPVTLARHEPGDPDAPDRLAGSAFGAAWTASSLVELSLGGASSATYHEPLSDLVDHAPPTPLLEVVARLSPHAGAALYGCSSSHPLQVRWATLGPEHRTAVVINLDALERRVRLPRGWAEPVVTLAPYEVASLSR
jgi:hypothetical protein